MKASDQRQPVILIAAAAPREVLAIARGLGGTVPREFPIWQAVQIAPGFEIVRTGVGPAAAAGGVARALDPGHHGAALSLGVGGALPGQASPEIGSVLLATRSEYCDLGLQTPEGFVSTLEMGFGTTQSGDCFEPDSYLAEIYSPMVDAEGPVATVSACSGTDAHAAAIRDRLGAGSGPAAEGMEGASVGMAASVLGVAFAEIRVLSNTTGDRESQRWDLDRALARLEDLAREIANRGTPGG